MANPTQTDRQTDRQTLALRSLARRAGRGQSMNQSTQSVGVADARVLGLKRERDRELVQEMTIALS